MLPNNLNDFPSSGIHHWTSPGRTPRHRRGIGLFVLAIAIGVAAGVAAYQWIVAGDAAAGPSPRPAASAPGEGVPPADLVVSDLFGDHAESQNWSGYAATAGGYTAVTATWTIADLVLNSPPGTDAAWVGIGGVHSGDLIQAGTLRTVLGGGNARQEAWIELLPQGPVTVPLAIKPGDSIVVAITQQGPENWLVAFDNLTSGQSYQATRRYASSLSSVEWVAEAPSTGRGRPLPLDNFGTLRFEHASATRDDQAVTIAESGARAITMITPNGQHLVEPSSLSTDGTSFTLTRTSTPSTSPRRR